MSAFTMAYTRVKAEVVVARPKDSRGGNGGIMPLSPRRMLIVSSSCDDAPETFLGFLCVKLVKPNPAQTSPVGWCRGKPSPGMNFDTNFLYGGT